MNFDLSPEQAMLADTLSAFLERNWDEAAHAAGEAIDIVRYRDFWRRLCEELGLAALMIPTHGGGLGRGAVETMIVMQAFGKALVHGPYLSTIVLAGNTLAAACASEARPILDGIIAGDLTIAFAHNEGSTRFDPASARTAARRDGAGFRLSGTKSVVLQAPVASHLLVTGRTEGGGTSLFLVPGDTPDVTMETCRSIDGQPAATVRFDGAKALFMVGSEGEGAAVLSPWIDHAILAQCAEAVGIIEALISHTAAYLVQRRQFGQPLSAFQALQHRLADMVVLREQARSMLYMAVLTDDPARRKSSVSAAKILIDRALRHVSQQAVQLHGGMGITDELRIGRYFKRGLVICASFGSEDEHFRRYDAEMLTA